MIRACIQRKLSAQQIHPCTRLQFSWKASIFVLLVKQRGSGNIPGIQTQRTKEIAPLYNVSNHLYVHLRGHVECYILVGDIRSENHSICSGIEYVQEWILYCDVFRSHWMRKIIGKDSRLGYNLREMFREKP